MSLLAVEPLNGWFEYALDSSLFRNTLFEVISILIGMGIVSIGLYFFQDQGLKSEQKSQQLVKELHAKNQQFEQAEVETKQHLRQLEVNQQEEKKRTWASEGLAKFSSLLRATQDVQHMYDTILSELVKYMGANQGGFYIVEHAEPAEEGSIRLASCYAYERKKFIKQRLHLGEGLLGQAFLEQAPIFMTHVPQNYVRITSGLGEATPQSIVIMPLMVNDQVEGLIELASFTVFEPYQLDFLQTLGEGVASAIANNRINLTTKQLLETTQQQAEEMQAQEEMMRQNLEEILHKSSDIESRMNAIDESGMASIEFDTSGNIKMANANFLALMGYGWGEIRGQHHRIFVTESYAQSEEY